MVATSEFVSTPRRGGDRRLRVLVVAAAISLVVSGCSLFSFGSNSDGQLATPYPVAEQAFPGEVQSDWLFDDVALGAAHTCGISAGDFACWGNNVSGQLGTGDNERYGTPNFVVLDGSVSTMSLGQIHTCYVDIHGDMYCTGSNSKGQLGIGPSPDVDTFTAVISAPVTEWRTVAAGGTHTCAIQEDSTLWCWGSNEFGQLGLGTTTDHDTRQQVGTDSDWESVQAGAIHTCAVKNTGQLWCWGRNDAGQLGVGGAVTDRLTPTRVGNAINWESVSLGRRHTCATKTNGALWCWGRNDRGQLGLGTTTDRTTPGRVGLDADWGTVAAAEEHTCAVKITGQLWCWGNNEGASLGLGTYPGPDERNPVRVGIARNWTVLAAGGSNACAANNVGHLFCWGGGHGQLGFGALGPPATPFEITTANRWDKISAGGDLSCGLIAINQLWCWGDNKFGQIGQLTTGPDSYAPTYMPPPTGTDGWLDVGVGDRHVCAIATDDKLYCWGHNSSGQLGLGTFDDQSEPTLADATATWSMVEAGFSHTCAIRTSGELYCWGSNARGQVGIAAAGGNHPSEQFVDIEFPDGWTDVALGGDHTCALQYEQFLYCWGKNVQGQLGAGDFADRDKPEFVHDHARKFDLGLNHTCVVSWAKRLSCAGENVTGELGLGHYATENEFTTADGDTDDWTDVGVGYFHTCGLRAGGELWCWGFNASGQLGLGPDAPVTQPVRTRVTTSDDWTSIAGGREHTLAIGG